MTANLSRRRLLGMAGVATAAGAMSAAGLVGTSPAAAQDKAATAVAFWGSQQAGIRTPVQERLFMAAFDVTTSKTSEVVALMRTWTQASARLTSGLPVGEGSYPDDKHQAPQDTGDAEGLDASRLSLTIGFGGAFLDRLGLPRPAALEDLPAFKGERLERGRCGGDIVIQACADDSAVALHAVRNLIRLGRGTVRVRWSQLGFGRISSSVSQDTPRDLFGFKDGTANDLQDDLLWAQPHDGPAWMTGGSYLVARRISMNIETWDNTALTDQEHVIGRYKASGAPFGHTKERDDFQFTELPPTSHVRMAQSETNDGKAMLRRGYSFADGTNRAGHLDAGLFFLAFQRDPRQAFTPIQAKLAGTEAMSPFIRHNGSGLWACPPGVRNGGFWGDTLLG